ncbi:MutS2 family protein [Marinitoga piezophila KA3]|uniref:Endonuclease MutS2 n=1 Tax=Marinitoga piezophila (strain DSM 14283 / JCM 11233 / KA3) TaxID=443254 RepID=H2J3P3_MARPK|nr:MULTISPECIES: endonuclease MutS2 [Marinitoga]AEX84687.1 MutS2 family protein [Marinitoga piezophila KA3]
MNSKTYKDLEIDKILNLISSKASSRYGKRYILEEFEYFQDYEKIEEEYKIIDEINNYIYEYGEFDIRGIPIIYDEIKKVENGTYLDPIEYKRIADFLSQTQNLYKENRKNLIKYTHLQDLIFSIPETDNFIDIVYKAIDEDGNVKDSASDLLRRIRKRIENNKKSISVTLRRIIGKYQKYVSIQQPTVKNNRYCIVIRSEYKNKINGSIIAYSDRGVSVYIEPYEVGKLNAELSDLFAQEKAEISRILGEIYLKLVKILPKVKKTISIVEYIDSLQARIKYAKENRYVFSKPEKNKKYIYLSDIRHPLIEKEKVVPVTLKLPKDKSGMIITGPNTGGKTVVLKSVGISVVFSHAVYPVPAEMANIPYITNIFTDIGDEQSIEQTLSTFSSHLKNIKNILDNAHEKTLVLIDELGTGTDPIEGSALAIAIIEKLLELNSTFFITSHLSAVKMYSIENERLLSASMGFDKNTLSPTYRLLIGVPGASHAIDIAERLGLPHDVLVKANNFLSKEQVYDEKIIENLSQIYEELEKEKELHKQKHKEVIQLQRNLEEQLEIIKKRELEKIDEEIKEYKEYLKNLKKDVENYISILKNEKNIDKIKDLNKKIEKKKRELEKTKIKNNNKKNENNINIGDVVLIGGEKAKVIKILKDKIQVKFIEKPFELTVSPDEIKLEKSKDEKNKNQKNSMHIPVLKPIKNEIDIRGYTVEDAIPEIEKFISDLIASNMKGGYIIHGKGTGKLAMGIWAYLRKNRRIKSFRLGNDNEGGTGVTYVEV